MDNKNDNQNNYDPTVIPEDVKKLLGIKDEKKEVKNNDIFSTDFHVLKKRKDQFESEKDEERLKKDMAELALTFKEKKAIYDLDFKENRVQPIKDSQSSILESIHVYDKNIKKYKPFVNDRRQATQAPKEVLEKIGDLFPTSIQQKRFNQITEVKSGIIYKKTLRKIIKRKLIEIKSSFNNISKSIQKSLSNVKLKFYNFIFNLNLKINKKLFLMSLPKEKRESLKNMAFDPHSFNNNSAIVKLILKKNVDINKIKKSAEKINNLDLESTDKAKKPNKISKIDFFSNNNNLLFE